MTDQPTIEIIPPPHLVTPPPPATVELIPPPHLFTPPAVAVSSEIIPPPHLITPPPTLATPSPEPLRPRLEEPPAQPDQALQPPAQQSLALPDQATQPPALPDLAAQSTPKVAPPVPSRRAAEVSELDALLMHVEAGNLGGPSRKLSVATASDSFSAGQPSPVPLPPPLPQYPKAPSGSPKLQRTFTAERALTPPTNGRRKSFKLFARSSDDGTPERPPSPHNTNSEIHFSALKRDIKKSKNFLHRLTVSHKSPVIAISSPQPPSGFAPFQPPPTPLSPAQPVPISKKKERQSFMFASKPAPFTIPIRVSCVSSDADTSASKLVWEIDLQVGPKMKVAEIWERIKESGALEGPETHAICKDDEILSEKEYLNKYKLKQNDVLKVRPRTKKVVKKQLNNLIARRPSRDELISRHIISTKTSEATVDSVPDVETIQRCVEFLVSTEAYKQEGLFRISAGAMNAKTFYETFRKHEPDFTMIESHHTVAGAIKQYFRGLPAGLIPIRVAIPMRESFQKLGDTPELYKELAEQAKLLPRPNLQAIDSVFQLVLLVIKNQETSKMDDRNCSIVFAPNVFAFDTNMDLMAQSEIQTKLVHIFFKHYEEIFGPATSTLTSPATPAAHE